MGEQRPIFTWMKKRREVWDLERRVDSRPPFDWRQLGGFTLVTLVFWGGFHWYGVQATRGMAIKNDAKIEGTLEPAITNLEKADIKITATLKHLEGEMKGIHRKLDALAQNLTTALVMRRRGRPHRAASP